MSGAHDDVAARDVCANEAKADVLVGIYFDAGTSAADAGCLSAYDTARPFAAESKRLATLVQTDVLGALNAHGWQVPEMPGTITEPLYLTDPPEGTIADSALGQQAIAHGIAQGVEQYFGPSGRPRSASRRPHPLRWAPR